MRKIMNKITTNNINANNINANNISTNNRTTNKINNIVSNLSIRIILAFHIKHDKAWQEHKTKLHYTLWIMTSGKAIIQTEHKTFVAEKNDAVLFYPGDEYTASTDENGCDFIVIFFSLEMGNGMDILSGLNLSGIIKNIKAFSHTFCDRLIPSLPLTECITFEQYAAFTDYIYRIISIQQSEASVHFYEAARITNKSVIQDAINYISENYQNTTVQQVAKHVHMNKKRFITNFKNSVGLTPGHYIFRCKMKKAIELISTTDMKITEIAQSLGFADQYSFSKAFKRSFGEAPSDFKKNAVN